MYGSISKPSCCYFDIIFGERYDNTIENVYAYRKKKMLPKLQKISGFTIVELVVVIAVIGILSSIAIVSYVTSQQRATKTSLDTNAQQVKLKLGEYFTDNNRYPETKNAAYSYINSPSGNTLATEFNKPIYVYTALNASDGSCSSSPQTCVKYTITVAKNNWNGGVSDADIVVRP